jgi:ubiquitin-activating enzyme E1
VKDFQARISNQKVFLVGCGALGCEYLKGMSLMGVATGKSGKITVTDMDNIETSNLSRQFLFRQGDVGSSKSVTGARVVKGWNPSMNIEGIVKKVRSYFKPNISSQHSLSVS